MKKLGWRQVNRRGLGPETAVPPFRAAARVALLTCALFSASAQAVVIELKDVASDRVERQRAEAIGQLPLAGTPNISQLNERLAAKKMAMGNHMLIRVFKSSSELEVWMRTGERYELFATYPICNWSGTLGPKMTEGDKQSPEGVYTVTSRQLHLIGRHPRSLNLGFPNALDRQMNRTGSYILIHGGCGSVGCFAMTNPVIEEVFSLASAALNKGGQEAVQVHVFPFRMTEERLKAYSLNEWYDFWRNLKDVSDSFERTHQPPRVTVCEGRYWVEDGTSAEEVASQGPLAVCAVSRAEAASQNATDDASPEARLVAQPWWPQRTMVPPSLVPSRPQAPMVHSPRLPWPRERLSIAQLSARSNGPQPQQLQASSRPGPGGPSSALQVLQRKATPTKDPRGNQFAGLVQPSKLVDLMPTTRCNLSLASCRLWVANQRSVLLARVAAERVQVLKRIVAARR